MSRKSEARTERRLAKAAKDAEKSARLRERPAEPTVRFGANPDDVYQMKVTWACGAPDKEGVWSWGVHRCWSDDDWNDIILPKLTHFSGLTWAEIDSFKSDTGHKMHHFMEVDELCSEAQARLADLECSAGRLFRFRLGNQPRLWGIRAMAHFEVLWFDPTHKVYPVEL